VAAAGGGNWWRCGQSAVSNDRCARRAARPSSCPPRSRHGVVPRPRVSVFAVTCRGASCRYGVPVHVAVVAVIVVVVVAVVVVVVAAAVAVAAAVVVAVVVAAATAAAAVIVVVVLLHVVLTAASTTTITTIAAVSRSSPSPNVLQLLPVIVVPRSRGGLAFNDPAIDKITRMMNMVCLITSEDPSSDLLTSTNCISSPNFCCDGNGNVTISIMAKESLDICFSSPKSFVSTYKRIKGVKNRVHSLFQDTQKPQSQITEPLSNSESEDPSSYEEKIYVSEMTFLLMASNRSRRMTEKVLQKS
ncbi:hypothetical protein ALC62_09913, partial [Cyphomyrmex costatus]